MGKENIEHKNRVPFAFVVTVFFCIIAGAVAIIYAVKSNTFYEQYLITTDEKVKTHFLDLSTKYGRRAKLWARLGLIIGLVLWAIFLGIILYMLLR